MTDIDEQESASLTTDELIAMLREADPTGTKTVSMDIALYYGTDVIQIDLVRLYKAYDQSYNLMAKQREPEEKEGKGKKKKA